MKILCVGDIHLGRISTRLPEGLARSALASPRTTLLRSAAAACEHQIDLAVFAGDVLDQGDAYFEGHSALTEAITALSRAGIPCFAVAGNHDYDALRALSLQLPGLSLLGASGGWEEALVQTKDGALRLVGKSFVGPHAERNPLDDFTAPQDDLITLGVLHCDVDAAGVYHPVTLADLELKAPTAWILGHVHKPTVFRELPLIFYPGVLHPLDPGEPGPHGPWLLEIEDSRRLKAAQLPLSPLRYEQLEISLQGAASLDEARTRVLEALAAWQAREQEALNHVEAVVFRLRLTGSTRVCSEVIQLAAELEENTLPLWNRLYVERAVSECGPEVPLETLSRNSDPAGLLAKRLIVLEQRHPLEDYLRIMTPARQAIEEAKLQNPFLQSGLPGLPEEEELRGLLLRSGRLLLDRLLAQKAGIE